MAHKIFLAVILFVLSISTPVFAKPETSSVSSPKCDEAKLKQLCGDAFVKIEKAQWSGDLRGFNVTLETSKMTFGELTKKMLNAGCF